MDNDVGMWFLALAPLIIVVVLLLVVGILLILDTIKNKVTGKLKTFQLLAGASALGVPVFAALYHFAYDMKGFAEIFFHLAAIVCPLGLLVGGIGTIIIRRKQRRTE